MGLSEQNACTFPWHVHVSCEICFKHIVMNVAIAWAYQQGRIAVGTIGKGIAIEDIHIRWSQYVNAWIFLNACIEIQIGNAWRGRWIWCDIFKFHHAIGKISIFLTACYWTGNSEYEIFLIESAGQVNGVSRWDNWCDYMPIAIEVFGISGWIYLMNIRWISA